MGCPRLHHTPEQHKAAKQLRNAQHYKKYELLFTILNCAHLLRNKPAILARRKALALTQWVHTVAVPLNYGRLIHPHFILVLLSWFGTVLTQQIWPWHLRREGVIDCWCFQITPLTPPSQIFSQLPAWSSEYPNSHPQVTLWWHAFYWLHWRHHPTVPVQQQGHLLWPPRHHVKASVFIPVVWSWSTASRWSWRGVREGRTDVARSKSSHCVVEGITLSGHDWSVVVPSPILGKDIYVSAEVNRNIFALQDVTWLVVGITHDSRVMTIKFSCHLWSSSLDGTPSK